MQVIIFYFSHCIFLNINLQEIQVIFYFSHDNIFFFPKYIYWHLFEHQNNLKKEGEKKKITEILQNIETTWQYLKCILFARDADYFLLLTWQYSFILFAKKSYFPFFFFFFGNVLFTIKLKWLFQRCLHFKQALISVVQNIQQTNINSFPSIILKSQR